LKIEWGPEKRGQNHLDRTLAPFNVPEENVRPAEAKAMSQWAHNWSWSNLNTASREKGDSTPKGPAMTPVSERKTQRAESTRTH